MIGDDYASSFAPHATRCYRYICTDDAGRPGPCDATVRWQGKYHAANKWWPVVACDRHAEAITDRQPVAAGSDAPTTSDHPAGTAGTATGHGRPL